MRGEMSASVTQLKVKSPSVQPFDLSKRRHWSESIIQVLLFLSALISVLTTVGIVLVLAETAIEFFMRPEVTLWNFFTGITWQPRIEEFGIWPLLMMTLEISVIAMAVALPIGLLIAIYLSEYAHHRLRATIKPVLEILAGVPTVVFGYFALTFVTPILRGAFGPDTVNIYNVLSAGLVVGILILPLVSSMAEDALSAVPRSLREAAFGVGANKLETSFNIVVPAALSGLSAAFIVATSRAVGETMVVAIAAGSGPRNFPSWKDAATNLALVNPFKSGETMTGYMVRISGGDISFNSLDYDSLFAIGVLLFVMTLGLNLLSRRIVRMFREVYE